MKKGFFALILSLIFVISCSDGKNSTENDSDLTEEKDQTSQSDNDTDVSDNETKDDYQNDESEEDTTVIDEENDNEPVDEDQSDDQTEDTDTNDDDFDNVDGCLDININKTYDFGTVVHGSLVSKHVTLCNTCSATLVPDPVKKGDITGVCDSFFIRNLKVGNTAIDDATGLEILLSMSLASGECAEFDAVFDTEEAEHYPEPILCEVNGNLLNGDKYAITFKGTSAAFTTVASEDCPSSKGLCYIDGKCYTSGTNKEDNLCKRCNPETDASDWTNAAQDAVCDDLDNSTDSDKCNDSGACAGVSGNTSPTISQIDLGYYTACAVDDAGKGYCWGINNAGQNGSGAEELSVTKPKEVVGITEGIKYIKVGDLHACAVSKTGKVYCWGSNLKGQLGREETPSTTPVLISGITDATDITASGAFSCALLSDGKVKCWGDNEKGTLGNGGTENSIAPVDAIISNAVAISGGSDHVCAIIDDGTVKCWGSNEYKQLGDTTVEKSSTPVTIAGISKAAKISCGKYHSCVVLETGEINCWGDSIYPTLGNPLTAASSTPVEALVFRTATDVSADNSHSCATLDDGGAVCWGYNEFYQLGTGWAVGGSFLDYPQDVRNIISNVKMINAGSTFTCAIVDDDSVKCWGRGQFGQLGQGNKDDSIYPVGVIW